MPDLPTGTVTFLFTDIEGSTHRWEEHRGAMARAVARHDQLLRRAIESNRGSIFKTAGDAVYAVFASAPDAVAAAVEGQLLLHQEDWNEVHSLPVRMAVHTGTADHREGDYFGPPLNRVARMLAAGAGGQVLVSGTTAALAREHLPNGTGLQDLGLHRFRDLATPDHVFQVLHPQLPARFPPLASLDARPNNLPIQVTSFVGRQHELARVKELLATSRLLTLTGAGGSGKTRLSVQAAADLVDHYPDGVWFVDL